MDFQISLLDIVALSITALFAFKGNKLKLSKIILMAIIIALIVIVNNFVDFSSVQANNANSTIIIIVLCVVAFVVASAFLQDVVEKLIDSIIAPNLNLLIGILISTFIGVVLASLMCFYITTNYKEIKTTPITDIYINIAEVVIAKAPEVKKNIQEKTTQMKEGVEETEIPSDIGATIENIQK